jgi:hypothetical protein
MSCCSCTAVKVVYGLWSVCAWSNRQPSRPSSKKDFFILSIIWYSKVEKGTPAPFLHLHGWGIKKDEPSGNDFLNVKRT